MSDFADPNQDIVGYNRAAWDQLVGQGDRWTIPVTPEEIARARCGDWQIVLTPEKPVPQDWFPDFTQAKSRVLCLAGSGGQQAPILAAAGAEVTVLDNSSEQLGQDRLVADRDGLKIDLVQGDMADLSAFPNEHFDLIVHPCSNCFVPDVRPVWREASRVLKVGGELLSGFISPVFFIFDSHAMEEGRFEVRHSIPYSDLRDLTEDQRQQFIDTGEAFCFGHSLSDQIGGQMAAGLMIRDLYEDGWSSFPLTQHIATFIATRAIKLAQ